MDDLQKYRSRLRQLIFWLLIVENIVLIASWWALDQYLNLSKGIVIGISLVVAVVTSLLIMMIASGAATQPLKAIWQLILHLSPSEHGIPKPQIKDVKFGLELASNMANQIYQFAEVTSKIATDSEHQVHDLSLNFIAQNMPLPLIVLDPSETINFANEAAAQYLGLKSADMKGKNVYMVLDMSFPAEPTFDTWLKEVKTKNATATNSWERVRMSVGDGHPERLFDLAAYYNRENPEGNETMLVLFDHTKQYSQDEQAVSFIALSVHELRTPLTLLRGYIEAFEEELDTSGKPELADFMEKMRSQAEQLVAFVNNILNVARIDNNQLELHLEEAVWPDTLKKAIDGLSLRAKVRGISLHCRFAKDLPKVGVDRISITEVINNLIDNAIKYSGKSTVIDIETKLTNDGLVETTIKDYGVGIPNSVMNKLFTKFYRDHRNRAQIGGTGLGLYLSKAIVSAHGGNLWVRSKEGEGSTFGFTLIPFDQLTDNAKKAGAEDLVRDAHGWIKNHSLYRR